MNTKLQWRLPRAPLRRLCTLQVTSSSWPDDGAGTWEIIAYRAMDTNHETIGLRRVIPAVLGGPSGETIWVPRAMFEAGMVSVWRCGPDLIDPAFDGTRVRNKACSNPGHMGEFACSNRAQCWEPCGELGKSEEHARPSSRPPLQVLIGTG